MVLAVDLDLQVPGQDAFESRTPPGFVPGIVDFVREFVGAGQVPNVSGCVVEAFEVRSESGERRTMPSGSQVDGCATTIMKIARADLDEIGSVASRRALMLVVTSAFRDLRFAVPVWVLCECTLQRLATPRFLSRLTRACNGRCRSSSASRHPAGECPP